MSSRWGWATALVGGAAVIINGLFGRDLRNDVEMPMTEEEQEDKTPPTLASRLIYVLFGAGLFIYGLIHMLR
jgi:hypothetical protein